MPKICEFQNCQKRASYGLKYGIPLRCKEHRENLYYQYDRCVCGSAHAIFNFSGQSRKYCSKCKLEGMIDVKRVKCLKCKTYRPNFNLPEEKTPRYCGQCKTSNMIDITHPKCLTCKTKRPSYNLPDEKRPLYCKECKTQEMIDVASPKCKNCLIKQPIFNVPGQNKGLFCKNCKTENMVNVVSPKCLTCNKISNFGNPGDKKATYCSRCKKDGMIDIYHSKCISCQNTFPSFNYVGEKIGLYCKKCKKEDMVDVVSFKCVGCLAVQATFNFSGAKAKYCSSCKTEGMVNVTHRLCKGQNGLCTAHGNKKYKGYCTFCFSHMFPIDPLTFQIQSKTKEIATRDFINSNYKGFYHDKTLTTGHCECTIRRRIDHRKVINGTLLAIETVENQHKSYDIMDEETRYNDLYMAFSGKWIYIRFNPDKYIDKKGKQKNPAIATRLKVLGTEINTQIKRIKKGLNNELVERIYLYYDGYN
jgi:hypothetical protein